jgi:phosphate transport system substrate-binding protein
VDFGASDAPMTDDQLQAAKGGSIFHIPTALGAIVATYNIPEASSTQLNFTPDDLAGIFLGDIQMWNDPMLVSDNPVLASINDYLSKVSPDWQSRVGKGTSVNWPVGLGANGNPGVAGEVQQDDYSIGYVELIYAVQNNLGYATSRIVSTR